jgi:hemerythrin-like domain-containing protein
MTPIAPPQAPLAVLYDCHRRVLGSCATLRRLTLYVSECGCDRNAQVVSHGVLRFFDNEVPQHYADEEEDLFPALIESMAGSDAVCLHDLTQGSVRQHRALASQWSALRGPLEEIAAGRQTLLPVQAVEAFVHQCHEHIGLEDGELLPMAERLLGDAELARITRGMRERRGDDPAGAMRCFFGR